MTALSIADISVMGSRYGLVKTSDTDGARDQHVFSGNPNNSAGEMPAESQPVKHETNVDRNDARLWPTGNRQAAPRRPRPELRLVPRPIFFARSLRCCA